MSREPPLLDLFEPLKGVLPLEAPLAWPCDLEEGVPSADEEGPLSLREDEEAEGLLSFLKLDWKVGLEAFLEAEDEHKAVVNLGMDFAISRLAD